MSKLILILAIIGFCFSDEFDCYTEFNKFLEERCHTIDLFYLKSKVY